MNIQENKRPLLLLLDRGYYHFESVLLPVAKKMYEINGTKSILLTFHPSDFDFEKFKSLQNNNFVFLDNKISYAENIKKSNNPNDNKNHINQSIFVKAFMLIPERIITIIQWRKRAVKIINDLNPIAILLQKGNREEVPFLVKMAKKRKITTVAVQTNWGAIHKNNNNSIKLHQGESDLLKIISLILKVTDYLIHYLLGIKIDIDDIRRVKTKGSVDWFCIEDEWFKTGYINNGCQPDNIIITGAPESDALYKEKKQMTDNEKNKIRNKLNTPSDSIILLFLLTNGLHFSIDIQKERNRRLKEIIKYINKEYPNIYIWLSIHPRDNKNNYTDLINTFINIKLIDYTINQIYLTSDIVITEGSTSIQYAQWADKPTSIYSLVQDDHAEHSSIVYKTSIYNTPTELGQWINRSLQVNNNNNTGLMWDFCKDGHACERIVQKLYKNNY